MGIYQNSNGSLLPLAGRGKAEYGASTIRTGTVTLAILGTDERFADAQVTFSTPMPDANYEVELSKPSKAYYQAILNVTEKTVNGFKITASSFINLTSTTWASIAIDYVAYKLYTDNEYNNLVTSGQTTVTNAIWTSQYANTISKNGCVCTIWAGGVTASPVAVTAQSTVLAKVPAGYRPAVDTVVSFHFKDSTSDTAVVQSYAKIKTNGDIVSMHGSSGSRNMQYFIINGAYGVIG